MISATSGSQYISYGVNGLGQRVVNSGNTVAGGVVYYVYNERGHLG